MKSEPLSAVVSCLVFIAISVPVQAQVSFLQPSLYNGSGNAFVADFNGDGKPDILTSDGTMNLGNGDGTFKEGTAVSGTVLAVADFNGDGKADVLEQGTGTLLVLLGNGDGTFQAPISTASGAILSVVATADMNGDGKADVVGIFNSSLMVYLGNGDGTFGTAHSQNWGSSSAGQTLLSLGDFNGDSKIDVAVSTAGDLVVGQEIVLLGNGDGTFQTTPITSSGIYYPTYAIVGDFNGDGKLDLVLSSAGFCNGTCTVQPTVNVLLGNGDGTFQAPTAAFTGNAPMAAGDLRGIGKLDLVLFSEAGPASCQVYLGNGDGTFSSPGNYGISFGGAGSAGVIGDFNGDGKLDIAAGGVLLGNGDGTFRGIPLGAAPGTPWSAVVGDFEKKGASDIAIIGSNNLDILSLDANGTLRVIRTYAMPQQSYVLATADFNGDGNLDLLLGGANGFAVMLGNGDGTFQSQVISGPSPGSSVVAIADFNHDHVLDLAFTGGSPDELAISLGNGDGSFRPPVYYFDAGFGSPLIADFNGDGNLDIAISGTDPTTSILETGILFGNGDGTFQAMVLPTSLSGFAAAFVADFNNDGKPDLMGNEVALGNGDGTFTLLPPFHSPGGYIYFSVNAIADLNGDGKLDLLGTAGNGHPEGTYIVFGNGDGTFAFASAIDPMTSYGVPPSPVAIADMNGDGRPDIVFPWQNVLGLCSPCLGTPPGVAVLLNTTAPGFGVLAGRLSPSPVTAGNAATSSVTVKPAFGFTGTVTLACAGLPSGATCGFSPASIANSSGTSTLTITTTTSTAAGSYTVQVQGTSGSIVNNMPVSLLVQAAPGFTIGAASGSPTSQTISAGQTASFSLALAPTGSFTGTVNLSCAITPTVTPAPTCTLSNSSVQISGTGTQSVTVKMGTTASVTTSVVPHVSFPPGPMPLIWALTLLISELLLVRNRNRLPALATPIVVLAFVFFVGCGGGGSSSTHTTPGTPTGNYAVTITASSGSVSHDLALQVVVQ